MHTLIPAIFSLFFLSLSFFLSVLFLLLISNYYLVVGCFPFGLFFSWVSFSRCLLLSYHGFFPLGASASLGLFSFGVFSLFHVFSPLYFCRGYLPFHSELIQQDFSLLPLRLHQLFLVCCGHPFKITHPPIGRLCHCSVHVCCTITHFATKFPFVYSCCILLPLGSSSMACIKQSQPSITSFG